MAEFRYNPLLDDWTIVAGNRQNRPDMPKDYCAFCPGSGRVPDNYDVLMYENDWPSMKQNPQEPDNVATSFYKTAKSFGKAEVILYSPNHEDNIYNLTDEHAKKIVDLWQERFTAMKSDKNIKHILIFENRGKEVGTTQPHPHGQIYGYGFVPLRIKVELENCKKHYEKTKKSLILDIRDEELKEGKRIIMQNNSFVAFIPFFTDYPYGVYIVPKSDNINTIEDFSQEEKMDFAKIIKNLQGTFDTLFDRIFPYMMGIYQMPFNDDCYKDVHNYYHFHVKFFPPLRGANSIKWNASSETAAWAKTNPRIVEETAIELKSAYEKYRG